MEGQFTVTVPFHRGAALHPQIVKQVCEDRVEATLIAPGVRAALEGVRLFRVCITGCRRVPAFIQSFTYFFLLHDHLPCGMKPGLPVFTTSLNLCLV